MITLRKINCIHCHESIIIEFLEDDATVQYVLSVKPFEKVPSITTKKTKRLSPTCSKCGEIGHKSNVCKFIEEDDIKTNSNRPIVFKDVLGSITEDNFDEIKALQNMNYKSKEAADQSGFSIAIVNKIFGIKDWDSFQKLIEE